MKKLIVLVGILGLGISVAGVAFWMQQGSEESIGLIRIRQSIPGHKTLSKDEYALFKQTNADLLTSEFVLRSALRKRGVKNLEWLQKESNPVRLIRSHLKVDTLPESEIVSVSLRGPELQGKIILEAIVEAFFDETVNNDRFRKEEMADNLKVSIRNAKEKLRTLIDQNSELTQATLPALEDMDQMAALRKQNEKLDEKLIDLKIEIELQEENDDEAKRLRDRMNAIEQMKKERMDQLSSLQKKVQKAQANSNLKIRTA